MAPVLRAFSSRVCAGGRGLGKLSAPMGGGMGGGLGGDMGGGLGGGMGGGLGGGLGKISDQSLVDPFAKKKSPDPMSPEVVRMRCHLLQKWSVCIFRALHGMLLVWLTTLCRKHLLERAR